MARLAGSLGELLALEADWFWETDHEHRFTRLIHLRSASRHQQLQIKLGKTGWELGARNLDEPAWERHRQILHRREPFGSVELFLNEPGAENRWVEVSGVPWFDGQGQFRGYRGIGRDITQQKLTQQELLQTRQRLESTLAAIPDLMFELDDEARYVHIQAPLPELLVRPTSEIIGRPLDELLPPEVARVWATALEGARRDGYVTGHRYQLQVQKGVQWFELSMARKAVPPGESGRFIALVRDITIRTQQQQALEHAHRQLAAHSATLAERNRELQHLALIADRTVNMVIICDEHNRATWVNDGFARVTGYQPADILGREPRVLLDASAHDPAGFKRLNDALMQQQPCQTEILIRCRDGSFRWVELDLQPIVDERGRHIGSASIHLDITERKQMAEAALAASRAKTAFLANMSHEIRTPMSGLIGMSDLLRRTALDDTQQRMVQTLHDSATALLHLLNDLLDLSKIEAGKLHIDRHAFALVDLLQQTRDLMQVSAAARQISLRMNSAASLPVRIMGDPARLRQILINLLDNAIKFSAAGQEVRINAYPSDDMLHIEVRDQGIGIEPGVQNRIFEPFVQADASIASRFGGTGLGLAICRELARLMQGNLALVWSGPGQGSCFRLSLPLQPADTDTSERPATSAGSEHVDGLRVLLAEDDPVNAQVLIAQLESLGVIVCHASDGAAAFQRWKEAPQRYDLLLTDCRMPVLDGFGLARDVRRAEGPHRIPIIALTANAQADDVVRCREAGMDAHLTKPVTRDQLRQLLHAWTTPDRHAADEPADAAPTEPALFDGEQLSRVVGDDTSVHRRLLRSFVQSTHGLMTDLDVARKSGNRLAMQELLHRLKSSAATVGAFRLSTCARNLEAQIATHPAPETAKGGLSELEKTWQATYAELSKVQGTSDT